MFARMDEAGRAMAQSLQESPPTGLMNVASEAGHNRLMRIIDEMMNLYVPLTGIAV